MTVRGAPAIGVTAAYGIVLAAFQTHSISIDILREELRSASLTLNASRPTAVNLRWALERMINAAQKDFDSIENLQSCNDQRSNSNGR